MIYAEALRFLDGRQETRWKLGLSRIESLVGALGNPQDAFPAVHVAGTNGKGSFSALLASVLQAAGLKIGLFTSPHLVSPRERIRINGYPVSETDFAALIDRVRSVETEESSYFELLTAAAFEHFKNSQVDAAVVEVGLGGRLDATNVLSRPELSVITSIAMDHAQHLGDSLEKIAQEKAGILKKDVPCLVGDMVSSAWNAISARGSHCAAVLQRAHTRPEVESIFWDEGAQDISVGGIERRLGLIGEAAAKNAGLVLDALDMLRAQSRIVNISEEAVIKGFQSVSWPGRFQVVSQGSNRRIVLDGAHNPAAMDAFVHTWKKCPWREDALMVFGVLADKDGRDMVKTLAPHVKDVIASVPDSRRALSSAETARLFNEAGCSSLKTVDRPQEALEFWKTSKYSTCVVLGSFYLVGSALKTLEKVPA